MWSLDRLLAIIVHVRCKKGDLGSEPCGYIWTSSLKGFLCNAALKLAIASITYEEPVRLVAKCNHNSLIDYHGVEIKEVLARDMHGTSRGVILQ